MARFEEFYISWNSNSNCVIRSFCKLYNMQYEDVYNELLKINSKDIYDVTTFEEFMKNHNTNLVNSESIKLKDLDLEDGKYIVFCWNKDNFYHMVPIINNTIYDKNAKCLELYSINIYKYGGKNEKE